MSLSQATLTNIKTGKRQEKDKTQKTLTGSGVEWRELRLGLEASGELGTSHRGTSPHATPLLVQLLRGTTPSAPQCTYAHTRETPRRFPLALALAQSK